MKAEISDTKNAIEECIVVRHKSGKRKPRVQSDRYKSSVPNNYAVIVTNLLALKERKAKSV